MPAKKLFSLPKAAAHFVRISLLGAVFSAGFTAAALAGSADGTIAKIDENNNSITLTNGKTYKLPGEFDYSGFHPGQKVSVFYDSDPSGAYVTDIEIQGAKAADTETPNDDDGAQADGAQTDGEQADPAEPQAAPDAQGNAAAKSQSGDSSGLR